MKKVMIFILGATALVACTTDTPTETTTATNTNLYTAWACLPHETREGWCRRFFYGTASTDAQAGRNALRACGSTCTLIWTKPGCVPFRLQYSRRLLEPDCEV